MRNYMDPVTENATAGLHAGLCWNILDKCLTRTINSSPFHASHHHASSCSCAWVREHMQRLGWADRAQADPPFFSPDYNYNNSSNGDGEGRKTFSLQLPSVLQESNAQIMFLISISMPWPVPPLVLASPSQRSHFLDYLQKQTSDGIGAYTYVYVYARSPPPLSIATPTTEAEADGDINRDRDGEEDEVMHTPEGQEDDEVLHAREGQEDDEAQENARDGQEDDEAEPDGQEEEDARHDFFRFMNNMPLTSASDSESESEEDDHSVVYPPSPPAYSYTNREPRPPLSPIHHDDDPTASRPFKIRRL